MYGYKQYHAVTCLINKLSIYNTLRRSIKESKRLHYTSMRTFAIYKNGIKANLDYYQRNVT